jgi:hypothetical protein
MQYKKDIRDFGAYIEPISKDKNGPGKGEC